MRLRPRVVLVTSALVGLGLVGSWMWANPASATPTIESVTTADDYASVTVVFSESVSGSGTGTDVGEIVAADVTIGAGATLQQVTHTTDTNTVVLGFDGAAQPGTAITITSATAAVAPFVTGVPVAEGDWAAIEASLRAIELPVADVPIAPYLTTATGDPRTLGELLPPTTATSLDLPAAFSIARATDGKFTVSVDGAAPVFTTPVTAAVALEETAGVPAVPGVPGVPAIPGVPYGLDLTSADDDRPRHQPRWHGAARRRRAGNIGRSVGRPRGHRSTDAVGRRRDRRGHRDIGARARRLDRVRPRHGHR